MVDISVSSWWLLFVAAALSEEFAPIWAFKFAKMPEYGVYIDESWDLGYLPYLVGGLEHVLFFHILRIIIPTD